MATATNQERRLLHSELASDIKYACFNCFGSFAVLSVLSIIVVVILMMLAGVWCINSEAVPIYCNEIGRSGAIAMVVVGALVTICAYTIIGYAQIYSL